MIFLETFVFYFFFISFSFLGWGLRGIMRPDKKKVRHHDSRKKAAQDKQKSEQKDPQPKAKRVIESNWDVDKPDFPQSSDEEGAVDDALGVSTGLDFNYVVENRSDH